MTATARPLSEIVADLAAAKLVARDTPSADNYAAWNAAHRRVEALRAELWTVAERPTMLPLRIAGETREVAVTWYAGKAFSVGNVGLARVRPGAKLWPMRATFFMDDTGAISGGQTSDRVLGKACAFVVWLDAKVAAPAVSASLHAASDAGDMTRAKAAATRARKGR